MKTTIVWSEKNSYQPAAGRRVRENFTDVFGRSPMNLVNHVRMQHAAEMLAAEGQSIDKIARIASSDA